MMAMALTVLQQTSTVVKPSLISHFKDLSASSKQLMIQSMEAMDAV